MLMEAKSEHGDDKPGGFEPPSPQKREVSGKDPPLSSAQSASLCPLGPAKNPRIIAYMYPE